MKYDLYIDDQLCDLNEDSLISLTYTMENLTNPTVVRNSYSHEVSLPQTPQNDRIFNSLYRNDYRDAGATFSPMEQVPFVIYNEMNEVAERGYIKVSEITFSNHTHTYGVTLFGGLGSFFYDMAYDNNGEALTLADLQYRANAMLEELLDFNINRVVVSNAWHRLANDSTLTQYDVFNFAPTYQGVPSGEFDASKALYMARATTNGGDTLTQPIYGVAQPKDGNKMHRRYSADGTDSRYRFSLVDLGEEKTEWEMKDLRSYLQRPVLRINKLFEAIKKRASALGYTFDLDSVFFNESNPYYHNAWMTLPSLQSLTPNSNKVALNISGEVVVDGSASQTFTLEMSLPSTEVGDFGTDLSDISIVLPDLNVGVVLGGARDIGIESASISSPNKKRRSVWFVQVVGKKNENVVVASEVKGIVDAIDSDIDLVSVANKVGYLPANPPTSVSVGYEVLAGSFLGKKHFADGDALSFSQGAIEFSFKQTRISEIPDYWELRVEKYCYTDKGSADTIYVTYKDGSHILRTTASITTGEAVIAYGSGYVQAAQNVRSGALIRKKKLYDIGKTPTDVMLSYAKLFGLVWHYEAQSNNITLMPRSTFYTGQEVDWSARIDHSKDITIKPFVFDKRFYDFQLEAEGTWAEAYKTKYGRVYGSQRVNTGYAFDNEAKNLLDGNALKGGAEVLEQSKFFCNITKDNKICPSVFLDGGKYQLYNGEETKEYDVESMNGTTVEHFNELFGYDAYSKLQLHKDGKLIEGGGTLLLHMGNIDIEGTSPYRNFRLTDDQPEMSILNEGTPCWILEGSIVGSLDGETIPRFVRAGTIGGAKYSLDMGIPQELDNPEADKSAVERSIYSQYWAKYLSDRYDKNSRVMTAYVDLRGVQVNNALFRKFYYFDNAWWALNKINNYSITVEGSTQCEFVKIQNRNNYK